MSLSRTFRRRWPHVSAAITYAERVVAKQQPSCLYVRQACERQLTDLDRADSHFVFDVAKGERICSYIETLPHVKGEWAQRGARIRLEPWQAFKFSTIFGWVYAEDEYDDDGDAIAHAGNRRFKTAYIETPRKNAKALALDTLVATPRGFKPIRDVHPGDIVFGRDGRQVKVLDESPTFVNRRCLEVEFSTGERFVCDEHHLWATKARVDSPGRRDRLGMRHGQTVTERVRTAAEIERTVTYGKRGDRNHVTAIGGALQCDVEDDLLIDPYVLGVWLGDGHTDAARITNTDAEVLDAVRSIEGELRVVGRSRITYAVGQRYVPGESREGLFVTRLRALGVLGAKHIPIEYQRAAAHQRAALLRGLMDTDGSISPAGQCTYVSTSKRLAEDVRALVATLGIKTTWGEGRAKLRGREVSDVFHVRFFPHIPAFTIARKLARQRLRGGRSQTRTIAAVREVPSVPTKCLQVDGSEFLIGRTLVPTHNSTGAAGVGLYMLREDGEAGAEVFSIATTFKQAKIVFGVARQMALRADLGIGVQKYNLHHLDTASLFEPLHAQGETLDGLNIHCAINDEVHAWKKRAVYDVVETAMGARKQPLMFNITTAGNNLEGICYEIRGYAVRVLGRLITNETSGSDESFFAIIYTIDEEDRDHWQEREVWKKANPNWGVSVYPLDMESMAKKAREVPSQQNAFLTKRLNVWVNAAVAWMDMVKWQRAYDPKMRLEDFKGVPCRAGIDLASKIDINSLCVLFEVERDGVKHYYAFMRHWLPEAAIEEDRFGQYDGWIRMGAITKTPGNVIDTAIIEKDVLELAESHSLVELGVDPGHNSTQIGVNVAKGGVTVVDVRPTVLNFSEPMKWLEAWVKDGTFHFCDPVLTWMVSNVVAHRDQKDNIYPRKENVVRKIDGLIALLIAINRIKSEAEAPSYQMLFV